jgi:drug/metabolite transporter (DMT)-like permease
VDQEQPARLARRRIPAHRGLAIHGFNCITELIGTSLLNRTPGSRTAPRPALDFCVLGPVLLLFALRLTLASSVSLSLNLEMVATAVLGVALFREHLGRAGWLGVAGVVTARAILAGAGGWPGLLAALLVAVACACWGLDNHLTALIDGIAPARSTLVKGAVAGATNLAIGVGA